MLEQYVLTEPGGYDLRLKSGTGEVASPVLEGFVLPIRALFDEAENLSALRAILGGAAGQSQV